MHTVRYAHCEGFTDICFADNGKFLTTGEDGDVRIWQGFEDLDNTSFRVGDKCFAIGYKNSKIYVSDELNELKRYDLKTNEFQGVVTSFTLPVTCISINKSNTHLVCGSSDFDIHLVDLENLKFTSFSGHDAPLLSILFDPLEKYFVSASCDGTARFWSVQNLNNAKTLTNLHAKSNDFMDSESWAKIAWHKDGGLIAVPCQRDIHFYERETWILKFKINLKNDSNPNEEFNSSIICFSPDGKYVLALTNNQMVFIHSIVNKSLIFKYSYTKKSKICSLAWNPENQNEIIFCDIKGNMGLIKPKFNDDNFESDSKKKSKSRVDENLEMDDLLGLIMDSDEKSNDSSKPKDDLKIPNKKRKRLNDDDEHEDEEQEEFSVKDNLKFKTNKNDNDDNDIELNLDDDDEEDADHYESLEKLKTKTFNSVKKEVLLLDNENSENDENFQKSSKFDHELELSESKKQDLLKQFNNIQQSFQTSSTPLVLPDRFMCWNSTGLITQFSKEGDESIEIEFHNASLHHTIHIKNQFGYTMADVSKEVVVLASPGSKSDQDTELNAVLSSSICNHSKLTCILLNSFDNSKEWNIDMLKKEYIKCVCASRTLIACATNRKFLRIYCLAGTQKEIICIPGIPICISAYDNCIFVSYSLSSTSVGYSIYHIDDHAAKPKRDAENGILPLSDGAKVEWIGFSDEGNPFCYDSNGYLFSKCLTVSKLTVWTPISHLRASLNHKSDNYWIVGVAERNQMIKAILCRGSRYPYVLPRPTLSTVHIAAPLTDPDSEKTKLEKEFWKNKYLSQSIRNFDCSSGNLDMDQDDVDEKMQSFESSAREALMKLFMLACKNNKEQRAFEVATIMDVEALQLAIKYATKTRVLVLAQNLNLLAERKAEMEFLREREAKSYSDFNDANCNQENEKRALSSNIGETSDIIVERVTQTQFFSSASSKPIEVVDTQVSNMDDIMKTPTVPLATSRLNPFARNSLSAAKSCHTPANDSSRSIINEIEETICKSSSSKEKDTWKPTPTRKLVKSKLSTGNTPTSQISSFFNNK